MVPTMIWQYGSYSFFKALPDVDAVGAAVMVPPATLLITLKLMSQPVFLLASQTQTFLLAVSLAGINKLPGKWRPIALTTINQFLHAITALPKRARRQQGPPPPPTTHLYKQATRVEIFNTPWTRQCSDG